MKVRRFEIKDAREVSALIRRNVLEVNIKDYPKEEMQELADSYNVKAVTEIAEKGHMYVACEEDKIIGTGAVSSMDGGEKECCLSAIFVLPEYQKYGVGRRMMEALEQDELFLVAERAELHASITACGFYEKLGYSYIGNKKEVDEYGVYRMEKVW